MIYADSNFYTSEYLCGKEAVIDTASFAFYARKASQLIKKYTFDNIPEDNIPECVKMCCCEIAERIYATENSPVSTGVLSESVGDMSKSYESSSTQTENLDKANKASIQTWLTGTGLLYRGV